MLMWGKLVGESHKYRNELQYFIALTVLRGCGDAMILWCALTRSMMVYGSKQNFQSTHAACNKLFSGRVRTPRKTTVHQKFLMETGHAIWFSETCTDPFVYNLMLFHVLRFYRINTHTKAAVEQRTHKNTKHTHNDVDDDGMRWKFTIMEYYSV